MPEQKTCEHCGKPLTPTPAQWARGLRTATKRFCDHACAAQWKARDKRVEATCPGCGKTIVAPRWKAGRQANVYCSNACYQQAHATTPLVCQTCSKEFVSPSYRKAQKYCCMACVPMTGADNPNFGKRHPGMFQHSGQFRLWLSAQRTKQGNPAWKGGSRTAGAWQHQSWTSQWAKANLPQQCAVCGGAAHHVHHIAPGRLFSPRILMQFRQNLVMLCNLHQRQAVDAATLALGQGTPRAIPFADRLPASILTALEQGDSVSSPLPGCDYSPLGTVGELIHSGHWRTDTA